MVAPEVGGSRDAAPPGLPEPAPAGSDDALPGWAAAMAAPIPDTAPLRDAVPAASNRNGTAGRGPVSAAARPDPFASRLFGLGGDALRTLRRFGLAGALLMAIGALGAGALPVPNPLGGMRVLGLPARNGTVALAVTYAGMGMVVLAWLWLGRLLKESGPDRPGTRRVIRTALLWAAPLAVAPPLFSRDVYSYLAQSAIAARGLDPFQFGPAEALGIDHPLTSSVPTIWRNTGAPYGPLFLVFGQGVRLVTGEDVLLGVIGHRVLVLAGFALIIWALPRLARRVGADPVVALWLGAANPLVLFHLVSGTHNEAIMLGLMLVGLEVAMARSWLLGAILITAAAAIKLPAIVALGFVGMYVARRRGGRFPDVVKAAALLGLVAVAGLAAVSLLSGLGFGWTKTLGVPSIILSTLSVSTDLALIGTGVGILAGLGDHSDTLLLLTRGLGTVVGAGLCGFLLYRTLRGRWDLLTGTALGLAAAVACGPVVHPWYLLWAIVPLAASAPGTRFRQFAVLVSAVVALVVPPTGSDFNFRAFQLPMAIAAGGVILLAALFLLRYRTRVEPSAPLPPRPQRAASVAP